MEAFPHKHHDQPDRIHRIDRETTEEPAPQTEPSATSSVHHPTISRDDQATVHEKTVNDLSKQHLGSGGCGRRHATTSEIVLCILSTSGSHAGPTPASVGKIDIGPDVVGKDARTLGETSMVVSKPLGCFCTRQTPHREAHSRFRLYLYQGCGAYSFTPRMTVIAHRTLCAHRIF